MSEFFTYKIPKKYKSQIDEKFCKYFVSQLEEVFDNTKMLEPDDVGIPMIEHFGGTGGWYKAFKATCEHFNKKDLLSHYGSLEWYDSDLFDGELCDIILRCINE